MDKVDMYHSCRWCKHYKNGRCETDNFNVLDITDKYEDDVTDLTALEIKEPESFYCSNWE